MNKNEVLKCAAKYEDKGEFQKAIEKYDILIKIENKNPEFFALRGYAKYKNNMFFEAIKDFDTAISLKKEVPTTYYFRACAKEKINDIDGALVDYLKSSQLDNNKADVHFNIGFIYEYKKIILKL